MRHEINSFYWVLVLDNGIWLPAKYMGDKSFSVFGYTDTVNYHQLGQIGNRIPSNEEMHNSHDTYTIADMRQSFFAGSTNGAEVQRKHFTETIDSPDFDEWILKANPTNRVKS